MRRRSEPLRASARMVDSGRIASLFVVLALASLLGAAPPEPSPDPTPSDAPTESAESAPARTTEENARLRTRAAELLASALPDGKAFRAVLKWVTWPKGPAPDAKQTSEPMLVIEYILTYVDARHWSLIERGKMRGHMRDGEVTFQLSAPPDLVSASPMPSGPVCEVLDIAIQSHGFMNRFGNRADPLVTLASEVDVLTFEESRTSIMIEVDNPIARKVGREWLLANKRITSEQARQREAWKSVVSMVIETGEFPRLARMSRADADEAGVRVEYASNEVLEWQRWNDRWIGRKIMYIWRTRRGEGQRSELTVEAIEHFDAEDGTIAALPDGTRVFDKVNELEFTIGSPVIRFHDEEIVLNEPLRGHPGDRLPALIQAATLRNREGDAAPTATKPAVVP